MIDNIQIVLITAITVVTIILTIVGIQLFFVLREARKFLKRVNLIGAELEKIGLNISHGYTELIGFFYGLKSLTKILDFLSRKKENDYPKNPSRK